MIATTRGKGRRWFAVIIEPDFKIESPFSFPTKRGAWIWARVIVRADRDLRVQGRALLAQALEGSDATVS